MSPGTREYTCLAIDDEEHALELIRLYTDKIPYLELVKTTTSPIDGLEWLRNNNVDILFLDIQMNDLTGMQLLNVADIKIPVILTTAYSEYAIESYDYQVVDYLLKPYSFDRFLRGVNRALEKPKQIEVRLEKEKENAPKELFIKGDAKNKFHRVIIDDILYIEGLRNYIQIVCREKKIITLQNLKDLEIQLSDYPFMRVHKSYIINLNRIDMLEGHTVMIGTQRIPVGASHREAFYERINNNTL